MFSDFGIFLYLAFNDASLYLPYNTKWITFAIYVKTEWEWVFNQNWIHNQIFLHVKFSSILNQFHYQKFILHNIQWKYVLKWTYKRRQVKMSNVFSMYLNKILKSKRFIKLMSPRHFKMFLLPFSSLCFFI